MTRRKFPIGRNQFIVVWNSCAPNLDEFVERTGMPRNVALSRASAYRKAGHDLKSMANQYGDAIDAEALNQLIRSLPNADTVYSCSPAQIVEEVAVSSDDNLYNHARAAVEEVVGRRN